MADQESAEVLEQDGPEQETEESTAAAEQAGEGSPEKQTDDETHKRPGGWLRKLSKAEQERDFWREEALRNRPAKTETQQAQQQEDKPPVKPKMEDFPGEDGWQKYEAAKDKYFEDLTDYKSKKAVENFKTESQKQSQQQEVANGWAAQCAEAEKDLTDFKAVAFSEDVPMTQAMMDAILTSDLGARIAYELGKNPAEAERISKLNPVVAIREIGKIESRIASTKSAAEEDEDKEPPAATTRAPRPPVPVRKTTSADTGLRDDLPYKEWERRRIAEIARKGK